MTGKERSAIKAKLKEAKIPDVIIKELLPVEGEAAAPAQGAAAPAEAKEEKPDIVILDIMLPDVNGLDICTKVRQHHQMPILLLTALGEEHDRIRGFEAGADDYLVKPFSPRELVARVKAILRRTSPNEAGEKLPSSTTPTM